MDKGVYLHCEDNEKIFLRVWDKVKDPKGAVQIIHGMAEHIERYDEFCTFLNKNGYLVYGDDHRGHGKSINHEPGYLGEDGFNRVVLDQHLITEYIKKVDPGIKVYIFAHSFGSFIGQEYITRWSNEIEGIILSGSSKQDGIEITLAQIVANIQKGTLNERKKAKLIDKLSFGSFNKNVEKPKNKFAWLSRDEKEVEKYIEDSYCGFISTINFYHYFFKGLRNLYLREKLKTISKEINILVLSGDMDPVGAYGRGVKRLYEQYNSLGIKRISLKLYKGGRHEMINEINKQEVYDDILSWIES